MLPSWQFHHRVHFSKVVHNQSSLTTIMCASQAQQLYHNYVFIISTATIYYGHTLIQYISLAQLSVCVQVQVTAHLKQHKRSDSSLLSPTHHNPTSCQQPVMHVCCHGQGGPLRVPTHQAQHGLGKAC